MNSTYYVIAADHNKYGPADVATLQSWADTNRLWANTTLEEVGTGRRLRAVDLGTLNFGPNPAAGVPPVAAGAGAVPPIPAGSNYARPYNATGVPNTFNGNPMANPYAMGADRKPPIMNVLLCVGLGIASLVVGATVGFYSIALGIWAIRFGFAAKEGDHHPLAIPAIIVTIVLCAIGMFLRFTHVRSY